MSLLTDNIGSVVTALLAFIGSIGVGVKAFATLERRVACNEQITKQVSDTQTRMDKSITAMRSELKSQGEDVAYIKGRIDSVVGDS